MSRLIVNKRFLLLIIIGAIALGGIYVWRAERLNIYHYDLMAASESGDLLKVSRLIEDKGVPVNRRIGGDGETALHRASAHGQIEVVKYLIKQGANPNIADHIGNTPILAASYQGYAEIVKILIDAGADVNAAEERLKFTPLHEAVMKGHASIVDLLLSHGANPNAKTIDGRTVIDWARAEGRPDVQNVLAKYKQGN